MKSFIAYTDIFYRVSGGSSQPHKNAITEVLSVINVNAQCAKIICACAARQIRMQTDQKSPRLPRARELA